MARRMLIDATHPEETRVVAIHGNRLEEFDYETATKQQLKGNIYLAKVTRVEPSLQAAFVEYGGNRHGFLAFSEIHPDYYRIPVADRIEEEDDGDDDAIDVEENSDDGNSVEEVGGTEGADEAVEEAQRRRPRLKRQYKIQEVIKRRQVLLVQVIKEERGNKGAALTTYLSLAGRYCVLMPNTSRGGGVSRKIANPQDRKRLKSVLTDLSIPDGMAVILRTAGQERSKAEIKRDYEYVMRTWDTIRETTLGSSAPALIHEEANLIRRSIRDLYTKDIDEILVAGEEGYRVAKDFMKAMIPSHAKKVQPYKDDQNVPMFQRYQVESQLNQIFDPVVQLRSGGSIVMHQTEALVAIDVNSGRATRERHIEETAHKTNLEAAEEIARQLRLRDLAGLVVIDFIDMEENRNDHSVERKLKEALRRDRARIQVGRISPFGLLEMSRQRLRPSLLEAMTAPCPTCGGVGNIPSTESSALRVLRSVEEEGLRRRSRQITVRVPPSVALYVLNHKRATLAEMEENYGMNVVIETDDGFIPPHFLLSRVAGEADDTAETQQVVAAERPAATAATEESEEQGRSSRRRGRGRRRKRRFEEGDEDQNASQEANADENDDSDDSDDGDDAEQSDRQAAGDGDGEQGQRKRRKRGRRGGRKRRNQETDAQAADGSSEDAGSDASGSDNSGAENQSGEQAETTAQSEQVAGDSTASDGDDGKADKPRRRRSPRRRRGADKGEADAENAVETGGDDVSAVSEQSTDSSTEQAVEQPAEASVETAEEEKPAKPKRTRRPRKTAAAKKAAEAEATEAEAAGPESADAVAENVTPAEPAEPAAAAEVRAETQPKEAVVPEPAEEPAAATPQPAMQESTAPAPSVEEAANDAANAEEAEDPNKPKRKGWWNRMIGS
ncbi:ribonuclease E/G [Hwanghaeella grinnelliae]|uniref:Ribonuclease E n=1 Tax=Hwanghaeella grinnelliae TaxID=2500179 RepID=A0A3S3UQA9_9PROT|nr:ribonuclease E/G [Hwanghaeella grinnelliae]RVU38057.1 ribonuclease E/G [Hwanghaeella grinnelliae]